MGPCNYAVHTVPEGDSYRIVEAEVNRDPEQYGKTRDGYDAIMINYLIDALLFMQWSEFPSQEEEPLTETLEQWCHIGRAMLGVHPEEE